MEFIFFSRGKEGGGGVEAGEMKKAKYRNAGEKIRWRKRARRGDRMRGERRCRKGAENEGKKGEGE